MISEEQFAAAEAFTADQIMSGDPVTAALINAILPTIMRADSGSHARAYAILFGTLMGERSAQFAQMGINFDFEQNLRYFGILARTVFRASQAAFEASRVIPPVPEPEPKRAATLLKMVPKGDPHADQESVPEQQPSDASPGGESGPGRDPRDAA